MIKKSKVLNQAGLPVENLHLEVESKSFVSDRHGDLELKAENPDSVVRINYIGSPEIRTTFEKIGSKITVDNGFRKESCNSDLLKKQIQLVNENGNPLIGIEVFSESGLTNTTTDENGMALIKVSNPDEYLNFDGENIEGQAIAFKSLPSQLQIFGFSTARVQNNKTNNAGAWWLGLLAVGGLLWNHSRNQSVTKKVSRGMASPVKITL